MTWWVLELITFGVLVVALVVLGPLIKRFGRSYAADVFRANPRTGKSYIVLMDIAYYLIFTAYILFTTVYEQQEGWADTVTADQLRQTTLRIGGMLLIMGILHGANVLSLPLIGRLLGLGRRLDEDARGPKAA
jgi:cytochrome c oxidase assembly factor CtaG